MNVSYGNLDDTVLGDNQVSAQLRQFLDKWRLQRFEDSLVALGYDSLELIWVCTIMSSSFRLTSCTFSRRLHQNCCLGTEIDCFLLVVRRQNCAWIRSVNRFGASCNEIQLISFQCNAPILPSTVHLVLLEWNTRWQYTLVCKGMSSSPILSTMGAITNSCQSCFSLSIACTFASAQGSWKSKTQLFNC